MKSDMENREWLNDYMSLKQVNPANPFIVPAGYFEEMEDHIVSHKNLDELKSKQPADGFNVPENYFDELSGNIQSRIAIERTLTDEDAGFTVPERYFENLEQQIESRIFVEEALAASSGEFAVPEGYFNQLTNNILDKTVNAGKVVETNKANGRGVIRKMFATTAFKYATAACFAVAIGGGILINSLNSGNAHTNSFLHKQLATVPIDDIKSYLQLNDDGSDVQQAAVNENAPVDDKKLEDALKKYADSVQ